MQRIECKYVNKKENLEEEKKKEIDKEKKKKEN